MFTGPDGKVTAIEFHRTEQDDDGNWIVDHDQVIKVKANFIISAFGSGLTSQPLMDSMGDVKLNKWGTPEIDAMTGGTSAPDVFVGGDLSGISGMSLMSGVRSRWYSTQRSTLITTTCTHVFITTCI